MGTNLSAHQVASLAAGFIRDWETAADININPDLSLNFEQLWKKQPLLKIVVFLGGIDD